MQAAPTAAQPKTPPVSPPPAQQPSQLAVALSPAETLASVMPVLFQDSPPSSATGRISCHCTVILMPTRSGLNEMGRQKHSQPVAQFSTWIINKMLLRSQEVTVVLFSRSIICRTNLSSSNIPCPGFLCLEPASPHPAASCLPPAGGSSTHVLANHPKPCPH